MPEPPARIEDVETFMLDMDGVLYLEDKPIGRAIEAVNELRAYGCDLVFLTNNSTKSRREYVEKLSKMGIEAEESEIMTSAYATAIYLSEKSGNSSCYVIGEDGLKEELENKAIEIVSRDNSEEASYVVVGMDRGINYEKIRAALRALLSGAKFIGTNPDPTYPTERGLEPGAGACIGAVSGAIDDEPSLIIGKPSTYMLRAYLNEAGIKSSSTAVVGDRVDTDVKAGKEMNMISVLVLTGATEADDLSELDGKYAPDYVFESLSEMVREVNE
ncbi:MAG: HAD-IIA family hydrolase [Candidatus Hadarchaeia archaeon]